MSVKCTNGRCFSPIACEGFGYCREINLDISAAMNAYDGMDRMGQAGVDIRIAAMTAHYPAPNSVVLKAIADELQGKPLP